MMSWHNNCTKYNMTQEMILALLLGLLAMPAAADVFSGGLADPTRPTGSGGHENSAPSSGVTAIRISGSERLAVIDGRTVKIGDRYGDAQIADIRPYEVILERAGRKTSLRLVPKLEKDQRPWGQKQ
jgi:MSHA biogenesis protein MshK